MLEERVQALLRAQPLCGLYQRPLCLSCYFRLHAAQSSGGARMESPKVVAVEADNSIYFSAL